MNKEIIVELFGKRDKDNDSVDTYISNINEKIRKQIGFSKYHNRINKIIKSTVKPEMYPVVATYIKGYEQIWANALTIYLNTDEYRKEIREKISPNIGY